MKRVFCEGYCNYDDLPEPNNENCYPVERTSIVVFNEADFFEAGWRLAPSGTPFRANMTGGVLCPSCCETYKKEDEVRYGPLLSFRGTK